jgi:predicted nucleic acid-binding Zn ribbon protein
MGEVANSRTQVLDFLFNKTMPACKNCGKEFEKLIHWNGIEKVYCSEKCRLSAEQKRWLQKKKKKRYCLICKTELDRPVKTCDKCRPIYRKNKRKKYLKPHPLIKCNCCKTRFIQKTPLHLNCGNCNYNLICKYCGNDFKSKKSDQKFCSRKCNSIFNKKPQKPKEEVREKKILRHKKRRLELKDSYVRHSLQKILKTKHITPEMIEQKKLQLKIVRKIKQLKQLQK